MDSGAFLVQVEAKKAAKGALEAIKLVKSTDWTVSYTNAQLCINELTNTLTKRLYSDTDGVVDMSGLLDAPVEHEDDGMSENTLTSIRTANMTTAKSVLRASKDAAVDDNEPEIVTRKDAIDEANQ